VGSRHFLIYECTHRLVFERSFAINYLTDASASPTLRPKYKQIETISLGGESMNKLLSRPAGRGGVAAIRLHSRQVASFARKAHSWNVVLPLKVVQLASRCLVLLVGCASVGSVAETAPSERLWGWPKGFNSPWGAAQCPAATYGFITKDELGCAPIADQCHPIRAQQGYSPFYGAVNCIIYTSSNALAGCEGTLGGCPVDFSLSSDGATCTRPDSELRTHIRNRSGQCVAAGPDPVEVEPVPLNSNSWPREVDGFKTAQPIMIATGQEALEQVDYVGEGLHPLGLTRNFRSRRVVGAVSGPAKAGLSQSWAHSHRIYFVRSGTLDIAAHIAKVYFGTGNNLHRNITRVYDTLNRVQQVRG
jgi:hypothetical protein